MSTPSVSATLRSRAVWLPLATCAAITGAAVGVLLRARPQLPDPVATHWDVDGRVNGVQGFGSLVVFLVAMTAGIAVLLTALAVATRQPRAMAPLTIGITAFLGWIIAAVTLAQRGLADAHDAPSSDAPMLPALGVGVLAGLLGWALTRPSRRGEPAARAALPDDAPRLDPPAGGAVAWSGHTRRSPAVLWTVLGVVMVPILALSGISLAGGMWQTAIVMLVPGLAALASGVLLAATVTVGRTGVRARGLGFVPVLSVPLAEIESAEYVPDTSALSYGGWGYRIAGDGTRALMTASGPALRINRAGQGAVVITVDDAQRAAAVVNTLVARRDLTQEENR